MSDFPLNGHVPFNVTKESDGELYCKWLDARGIPFTDPFFDETILKCNSRRPSRLSSVSSLGLMAEWANGTDSVQPTAFIFHISRCGSTLVTQMLSTSNENIVLSEAPFFDDLLRLPLKATGVNETDVDDLLQAAIKFYGQKRTGIEQRLFIKTDSWHLFFYKQLRRLYPEVPFVFIYRSPDEVLRSHQKQRGMQAVPGLIEPEVFGLKPGELYNDLDVYLAKVLECYFNHYLDIIATDSLSLFLNYNQGPVRMIKKTTTFTNTPPSKQDLATMEERSQYHSKKPGELFNEATVTQFAPCLNKAMGLYQTLNRQVKEKNY